MVVCHCSSCKHFQYQDVTGQYRLGGRDIDAPTARAHYYADQMAQSRRAAAAKSKAQEPRPPDRRQVENAIFLATMTGEPSRDLPVRRRDGTSPPSRGRRDVVSEESNSTVLTSPPPRVLETQSQPPTPNTGNNDDASERGPSSQDPATAPAATPQNLSAPLEDPTVTSNTSKHTSETPKEDAAQRTAELGLLESSITLRSRPITNYIELKFESPPFTVTDPPTDLEKRHRSSQELLRYRSWVSLQLLSLRSYDRIGDKQADRHLEVLIEKFEKEIARLDNLVLSAWRKVMVTRGLLRLDDQVPAPIEYNSHSKDFDPTGSEPDLPPFILAALCMVSILHTMAGVARPQVQLVLATLQVVLFGAFTWESNSIVHTILSEAQTAVLRRIPLDIRTALSALCLEPEIIIYAACPTCCATYAPDPSAPDDPYPHYCLHAETDRPPCGVKLVSEHVVEGQRKKDKKIVFHPLRPFPYRSLKAWLEQLLRRSGVEELLESCRKRPPGPDAEESWEDIMDAPAIRDFKGPDHRTLFSIEMNGSLHLVFGIFIDWFNPHGNKQAGKRDTVGAIYLVLLNLPPHLRFRPEYIYLVGIIPGPHEPSLDQINHFLRPLVDELLEFWHSGVYFARTAARQVGRLVRAAIIPLICDLPALRKTAGFAHYASNHFCSFCRLRKTDISNAERSTWPKGRSWGEHYAIAKKWRDAPTQRKRDQLFDDHGLRWSELLRLEYWNPTKYALVDTMHNLFLGELKHHCMDVWGLAGVGERRAAPKALAIQSPEEQRTQLNRVLKALKNFSSKTLKAIRKDYILAVAQYNKIALPDHPEKKDIADALLVQIEGVPVDRVETVIRIPLPHDVPVNTYVPPGFVSEDEGSTFRRLFSYEVLDQIRKDITKIVVPSWIEKPPSNFGSSMHGKLKADQWRTICTIHMVITLVRLWGKASATEDERSVLNNFIHLVVAVDAATRRSMSTSRATLFDENMEAYVKGLRSIYKHTLVPNHHLSLHLKQCLLLFGPVRGWWSYPFERYNGLLQRLNTNHRIGDTPVTFMRYFYMGASLRWLLRGMKWPDSEVYQNWMMAFTSAFKDATRGTRYTDILSFLSASDNAYQYNERRQTTIPRDLYDQLYALIYPSPLSGKNQLRSAYDVTYGTSPVLPSAGDFVNSVTRGGITYSTFHAGKRNSYVTFTLPHVSSTQEFAGRIESILYHRRRDGTTLTIEPFVVIRQYSPLSREHAKFDAFRAFDGLDTQLYYDKFEPQARVIRLSDIVAHNAVLTYTPEYIRTPCIVTRSLNRVCAFDTIHILHPAQFNHTELMDEDSTMRDSGYPPEVPWQQFLERWWGSDVFREWRGAAERKGGPEAHRGGAEGALVELGLSSVAHLLNQY